MDPSERELPDTAIVTVSYGSGEVLRTFLASVPGASAREVLVVIADNKPDRLDAVDEEARLARADYLPLASNLGYGGAMNAAVARLPESVRWVLISNPDVVLSSHALDVLVEHAGRDPFIAAVGPAIYTAEGVLYPSARDIPSLRTGIGHALFSNFWSTNPWTRSYRREGEPSTAERDAGWLSGACLLVRRAAFEEIGGFDPGYFMYFEDVDLGFRFSRAGYRNLYVPSAAVTHSGAHATNSDSGAMIAAHHASAKRFLASKYRGPWLAPLRWSLGLTLSVRSAVLRRRISVAG